MIINIYPNTIVIERVVTMTKRILLILLAASLAITLAACGGEDLTAKREALRDQFNGIVRLVEENNNRVNEAIDNGAEIPQDAIDVFNSASADINNMSDVLSAEMDDYSSEELDDAAAALRDLENKLNNAFGQLEAYLDVMQGNAGGGETNEAGYDEDAEAEYEETDADEGIDREAIVNEIYRLQEECNTAHNNVVSLIETGAEVGIDFDPGLVALVDEMAGILQNSQAVIESGALESNSDEELLSDRDALAEVLNQLMSNHAAFVEALEAAGYVVE